MNERDESKSREQLLEELAKLRQRLGEMEAALADQRQAAERFRILVESAADAFFVADRAGGFVDVNQRACDMLGYTREELLQLSIPVIDVEFNAIAFDRVWGRLVAGEQISDATQLQRKDGSTLPVEIRISAIEVGGARYRFGLVRDVTERRRLERQLIQLERLSALGEMAAGISHNLNNILSSVLGPSLLIQRFTDDPRLLEWAENIVTSTRRAADLVASLNQALRPGNEPDVGQVSVNEAVQDAVNGARPRWKDEPESRGVSIEVVLNLGDASHVRGTASRLHDMVIDLLLNAVDALPNGGAITIETRRAGSDVLLIVSDNGIGMNEETRRRVFEPFFTTKMEVGTGLGLSNVYGTLIQWGGSIEVESRPGEGATFTLRLPIWTAPNSVREESSPYDTSKVRQARVIIVDDDESVCLLLSQLLAYEYGVETFTSAERALGSFAPGSYDVALVDLGLPGMSGDTVARAMRDKDPAIVTVMITGWRLEADDTRLAAFDFHLQKPVGLERIRDVVDMAVKLREEQH